METTSEDVGTYRKTNSKFTDKFSGHYESRSRTMSIGPNHTSSCGQQYVIYARNMAENTTFAFKFDQALVFQVPEGENKFKVYLTCDGQSITTGTMDVEALAEAEDTGGISTFKFEQIAPVSLECEINENDTMAN